MPKKEIAIHGNDEQCVTNFKIAVLARLTMSKTSQTNQTSVTRFPVLADADRSFLDAGFRFPIPLAPADFVIRAFLGTRVFHAQQS